VVIEMCVKYPGDRTRNTWTDITASELKPSVYIFIVIGSCCVYGYCNDRARWSKPAASRYCGVGIFNWYRCSPGFASSGPITGRALRRGVQLVLTPLTFYHTLSLWLAFYYLICRYTVLRRCVQGPLVCRQIGNFGLLSGTKKCSKI
jgi:hypothetical protein